MKKKETTTFYYETCGECPYAPDFADGKCTKTHRRIKNLWGEIPDWCPLEDSDNTGKIKGG